MTYPNPRFSARGVFCTFVCALSLLVHATDDHLLICEAVLTPTSDEYIEITNPTAGTINLDNYYLSDDADYALLPGASGAGPAPSIGDFDFIAQFPPGATIDPDEALVIAFDGAGFETTFGMKADFEILGTDPGTPDMVATDVGASAGLTNSGENAVLFYWDGVTDLVVDVDMVNLGTPSASNALANKTGIAVDGPDADTDTSTYLNDAYTIPQQVGDPGTGTSTKRLFFETGSEVAGGGNGITGDDETTEDITITWDAMFTAPNPGVCNLTMPLPSVVINEVDADTDGTDVLEFIELYGTPNLALDGLVVVLFNGSDDASYDGNAYDLDGHSLNAEGFFVLGNAGVANVDLVIADGSLQNGADAVAIFLGDDTDWPNDTPVSNVDLVDAMVYDTDDSDDSGLLDVLTPGQPQLNERAGGNGTFHSNSRVPDGGARFETTTYVAQDPTPGVTNVGFVPPTVVINEVDADTDGSDTLEFIELYGTPNASLDNLSIVLFNGSDDASYAAFDLDGFSLDASGYFVLGNAAVANVDLTFPDNTLQNGADAVALLVGDAIDFPTDTPVTDTGLIDAIVYDTDDGDDSGLIDVLTPGQAQINERDGGDGAAHSNSRVPNGGTALDTTTYTQQAPTPGASNTSGGPIPTVVINEVDADTDGSDVLEFVELYGDPNAALDGLVIVLFNGSDDASYQAFDLDGQTLDANGFFVLGNAAVANVDLVVPGNTIQNGADAVALIQGDATDFPNDTPVTATNLIDAVVYDTDDSDDSGLLDVLTPGQPQVDERAGNNGAFHSNSRVPDGGAALNTSTYVAQEPTPGASNVPLPEVVINEVDADTDGSDELEFVELLGEPGAALDGLVIVFFNGSDDASYDAYDLDGQTLDDTGFFVLGNTAVANVDMTFANNGLQNGADAVALFVGDATDFPNDTPVTATNLIDAVVYDTDDSDDSGLLDVLTPGQPQLDERGNGDGAFHSNSRVPDGGVPRVTTGYTQQTPTPGAFNSVTSIADIQGDGFASPLIDSPVQTSGIVTAVGTNGFAIQTPDADADGNPDTSEGIWVFTGDAPTVSVGDAVTVIGTVIEFFDLTQITNPTVTVNSGGNPLPTPVTLDATNPSPNQPQDPLTFERLEGMLVSIASGTFTSGNQGFGTDPIAEPHIVASSSRSYREPGIEYPGLKGLPIWDGNPEVFEMDIDRLGLPSTLVQAGMTFSAEGVIGYEFGDYELWPTSMNLAGDGRGDGAELAPVPVRDALSGEVTVGALNLFRFFGDADRLAKFSILIREVMKSPDILAVSEAGSESALSDLATRINMDDPTVNYAVHMMPTNDLGGIAVAFLVRNSVVVNGVSQIQPDELFSFEGSTPFPLHDRPPLVLDAIVSTNGEMVPLTVVSIHNRSLNDIDDPDRGPFVRAKRHEQALRISQALQSMQSLNPTINLLVVGDFNGFEFTDGYVDVLGQQTGNPDPLGALVPATDELSPNLTNLITLLPQNERYSFNFNGNAQAIDHALASAWLMEGVTGMAYARANADYPEFYEDDPTTALRASDHDGLVVFMVPPIPPTVPTLSEWGMGFFTLLLAAAGVMMMRKRRH